MENAHPASDNHQRLCFTLGLWNGKDPILKERLYGLNGSQGELKILIIPPIDSRDHIERRG
jgi:hypothetical protein